MLSAAHTSGEAARENSAKLVARIGSNDATANWKAVGEYGAATHRARPLPRRRECCKTCSGKGCVGRCRF